MGVNEQLLGSTGPSGVVRNFKRGGHDFPHFSTAFFRQNKFKTDCETKKALGGSGGMLPRKNFENLHAVVAFLVLFE